MPESIRDQSQHHFEKKSKEISQSSDYNELFFVLNAFWDYLNPFLLQHIIILNCNEQLQSEMDEFLNKLELFMKNTRIDIFLKALPSTECKLPRTTLSLYMKEVITKHELSSAATLQHVDDIRADLCDTMRLTRFALHIAKLSGGSVIIMWYVTARVAELFAELEQSGDTNFKIISTKGR